jgi:tRNA (guanine9-N1)-methyltransferase
MRAPPQWRARGVGAVAPAASRPPLSVASARCGQHVRRHCRRLRPSSASARAAAAAADNDNTTAAKAEALRRVAYNRMRHERDRANRRARRQELSLEELDARRERGRREADARRAALAALAADEDSALFIAIDCAYEADGGSGATTEQQPATTAAAHHAPKAVRSLAKRLELAASANRRAAKPARLFATSYGGPLAAFAARMGAEAWPLLDKREESLLEVFSPGSRKCVVLSPDAALPLPLDGAPLDRSCVYVVGGIVDRTVKKGLTLSFAERHGLDARRLPVAEAAAEGGLGRLSEPGASKRPVLNVSDVVAALLAYDACGDWAEALRGAMPARKLVAGVEGARARGGRRRRPGRRREAEEEAAAEDVREGEKGVLLSKDSMG